MVRGSGPGYFRSGALPFPQCSRAPRPEAAALSFDDASLELLLHPDAELQDRQSGARFWHWEWVAWYQNRPGVEFIEKFLNGQDDDEYRFIRIGEDALDIEVRGILSGDPFSMALCTTIR